MALSFCPKCREKGFFWAIDEERGPLTYWNCTLCGYAADEDESQEADCPVCKAKQFLFIDDETKQRYRFCTNCKWSDQTLAL